MNVKEQIPEDKILRIPTLSKDSARFVWQQVNEKDFAIMWADETNPESLVDNGSWKLIVQGHKMCTEVKGGRHITVSLRIPMIFCSQQPLDVNDRGVTNRLHVSNLKTRVIYNNFI